MTHDTLSDKVQAVIGMILQIFIVRAADFNMWIEVVEIEELFQFLDAMEVVRDAESCCEAAVGERDGVGVGEVEFVRGYSYESAVQEGLHCF